MATVSVTGHFQNKVSPALVEHRVRRVMSTPIWNTPPVRVFSYQARLNMALGTVWIIPAGSETSIHHWCDILCLQMSSWRLMLKTAHAFSLSTLSEPCITSLKRLLRPLLTPAADQPDTCLPLSLCLPWMPASSSFGGVWRGWDHVYIWLQKGT